MNLSENSSIVKSMTPLQCLEMLQRHSRENRTCCVNPTAGYAYGIDECDYCWQLPEIEGHDCMCCSATCGSMVWKGCDNPYGCGLSQDLAIRIVLWSGYEPAEYRTTLNNLHNAWIDWCGSDDEVEPDSAHE